MPFQRYPVGPNSGVPEISPDGNTVCVPGGSSGEGRLRSRTAGRYITPADSRWPDPDGGVSFSVDGKFVLTSDAIASEVMDTWNIAAGAHDITLTVPGGEDEEVLSVGPGASELLSTGGLDAGTGVFGKLEVWSIPA